MNEIHKCGSCAANFEKEIDYLNHTCEVSGLRPTNPQHLIKTTSPNFEAVSKSAQDRGKGK